MNPQPLISVEGLQTHFRTGRGEVRAVRGVDLHVKPGEVLGIVGESGSGKSVTCMSLLRLLKRQGHIVGGTAMFQGRDLLAMGEADLSDVRGNEIAVIFQDPMSSLNPTLTVGEQVIETILRHRKATRAKARARAIQLFKLVRISAAEDRIDAYPHEFSGGMRQRAMIAMALACNPKLLIADEPTTALDVTVQAQILDLLKDIQSRLGMGVILITHDLGVIAEICDRVIVMYGGLVMEEARVTDLFVRSRHPYSQGLLASIPDVREATRQRLQPIPGSPPDMSDPPSGCPFAPRCAHAMRQCDAAVPPVFGPADTTLLAAEQSSRCWLMHPDAPTVAEVNGGA
jgi:oligopeptide transport system ATP-binding protein